MTESQFFPPQAEVGLTWCHGCNQERPVNTVYLPYLPDGIQSCRHCRHKNSPLSLNPAN